MSRALPPVGWQSIIEHEPQSTVVCACEKTVVMLKQPGHLTSMKNELGDCTKRFSLCLRCSSSRGGCSRSTSPMEMNDMVAKEKERDRPSTSCPRRRGVNAANSSRRFKRF